MGLYLIKYRKEIEMFTKVRKMLDNIEQNDVLTLEECLLLMALLDYLRPEEDDESEREEENDCGIFIAEGS